MLLSDMLKWCLQDYYKAIVASMTDIDLGMGQQNQGGGSVGASFQVAANSAPRGGQPPPPSYSSGGRSGGNEDGGAERSGPGGHPRQAGVPHRMGLAPSGLLALGHTHLSRPSVASLKPPLGLSRWASELCHMPLPLALRRKFAPQIRCRACR